MKHRLLVTIAIAALACASIAATASAERGGKGKLFQFRGEVVTASSTSVQVTVEGGNHAALRAMLGQSQTQTFQIGPNTEILVWTKGVPHVASWGDLKASDWVQVNIRAKAGSSLADVEANAPARRTRSSCTAAPSTDRSRVGTSCSTSAAAIASRCGR
jgi:hypothetical protein